MRRCSHAALFVANSYLKTSRKRRTKRMSSSSHRPCVHVHGDGYSLCIECGQPATEGLYKEYSKDNIRLSRCVRDFTPFLPSPPPPPAPPPSRLLLFTPDACPPFIPPGKLRQRGGPIDRMRAHPSRAGPGVASLARVAPHSFQSKAACQVAVAAGTCGSEAAS